MTIDYSDCRFSIAVGDRTRVSLYNEMHSFLRAEIEARQLTPSHPLGIEAMAMRLAQLAIEELEERCCERLALGPDREMLNESKAYLGTISDQVVRGVQDQFVVDMMGGLDAKRTHV
jgi:hypothetical protein